MNDIYLLVHLGENSQIEQTCRIVFEVNVRARKNDNNNKKKKKENIKNRRQL